MNTIVNLLSEETRTSIKERHHRRADAFLSLIVYLSKPRIARWAADNEITNYEITEDGFVHFGDEADAVLFTLGYK